MNTHLLKSTLNDIYNSFDPLAHMNGQLLHSNGSKELKSIVDKKVGSLSEDHQIRIKNEVFGWGPLENLKARDDIFDIIIKGPQHIYYENSQGLFQWNDHFLHEQSYRNFTEELFKNANLRVSQKTPFGNGQTDGFRIHVTCPPISDQINITLRKHRTQCLTLKDLETQSFLSPSQYEKIEELINNQSNFLIIGPTGSGKTTFLNSLIRSFPENQRSIIIEDTDELMIANHISTKLLTRESSSPNLDDVKMEELVKQSLRMRPDRIIVGEVRGAEAKDLLQALATGHSGSIGTIHATSAQQALYRLEMLIQMGASQWSLDSIRRLIQMSLDYLVVLGNDRYKKSVRGIYRITSLEKIGFLIHKEC